jgi:ribosomal-protein-alanine N-acetyltransferase
VKRQVIPMNTIDLPAPFPFIQTKRLSLRQMVSRDAEALYTFYSDPSVTRYLDWSGPSSIDESVRLIDSWNVSFQQKKLIPWGISLNTADKLIGTIMLMPTRGTFEEVPLFPITIGFDLDRSLWNKGIMSEGLQAVLAFGREHIGPHRFQAEVVPENTASLRILRKLGFKEEGLLKQYLLHEVTKTFLDVVMLALLNS